MHEMHSHCGGAWPGWDGRLPARPCALPRTTASDDTPARGAQRRIAATYQAWHHHPARDRQQTMLARQGLEHPGLEGAPLASEIRPVSRGEGWLRPAR